MRASIWKVVTAIRSSYWFLPSIMAFVAIVLGATAVYVDATFDLNWLDKLGWYHAAKAAGAREVLSTIAGSMITVAGVVFSITIVALSYASSQYGPRVLTNFMSDRGNTITLGTFIATFVYCLVVLRTIRGGEDGGFVPQLAVLLGLLFALCSIAVLIYFIHHVPQVIHVNHVVAGIGRQLRDGIAKRFPERVGEPARGADPGSGVQRAELDMPQAAPHAVYATATGYIQIIEDEILLRAAKKHDLIVRLHCRPGDFVTDGRVLFSVWPSRAVDDHADRALRSALVTGDRRTPHGDMRFLIQELVEIATRALSTGVNDPVTAITCIDWLGAALGEMARREMPDPLRADADGTVRVVALPDTFPDYVELCFGQLREYAAGDPMACLHLLRSIGHVAAACSRRDQIDALDNERVRLAGLAAIKLAGASRDAAIAEAASLGQRLALGLGAIGKDDATSSSAGA